MTVGSVALWSATSVCFHPRFFRILPLSLLALTVALSIVNLGYGFDRTLTKLKDIRFVSTWLAPPIGEATRVQNRFTQSMLGRLRIPLPVSFLQGIDVQKSDFECGFRSYFGGTWKKGGWYYYYFVGFLVEEPIGFQLMLYERSPRTVQLETVDASEHSGVIADSRAATAYLWACVIADGI